MTTSPMETIRYNWNQYLDNPNYKEIMDVLNRYINPRDKNNPRYSGLEKNLLYFAEEDSDEFVLDEPYNTTKKMATVIDSYSILAHIRQDDGDLDVARFLRTAKDYLMTQLALSCCKFKDNGANIAIGYYNDQSTPSLEIDIPFLGHLGWHFRQNG